MAAVPPQELWKLWKQEQITSDMAIGQLIQNQAEQQTALDAQRQTIAHLQSQINQLLAQPAAPPQAKGKKQQSKRA
ncbi:MAG: hypothetical protein U0350_13645 [Caldilineaceae bacterium]